MRGSVVKKGGRWYVKIELDPDPATGGAVRSGTRATGHEREAERARVDLLSKFDRGEYVEPSHQTVADFLTDWLTAIEHTVRPSTFDSYSRNVHNHVIAHIGTDRLTKVDAGVLNGLYVAAADLRPTPAVEDGHAATRRRSSSERCELRAEGLHARGHRRAAARPSSTEAEHITKDTLASLLRRQPQGRRSRRPARGPRPAHGQLRPHDPAPRVQGRRPLGPARPQPGRRRRPATRRPEVRRRPRLGRGDAPPFLDASTRDRRPAPRAVGPARHDRHAARRGARPALERTSTSTPAGSASCRRSRRPAAW